MAHSSESSDSVDSGSGLSEFEDIEPVNNVEIVPWRFEPRGRPREERSDFEREERLDHDNRCNRQSNTDW